MNETIIKEDLNPLAALGLKRYGYRDTHICPHKLNQSKISLNIFPIFFFKIMYYSPHLRRYLIKLTQFFCTKGFLD